MLSSSRKRLVLYLGLAVLFNLRYVIDTILMPSLIANTLGRLCGSLLLIAIVGEIIARLARPKRQP
jgi:hypothetical protein